MTRSRAILSLFLALLLGLTSVGVAGARGGMAADGVICGTGGAAVILAADGLPLVDGGGAPVELDALPCLDCAFGALALDPAAQMPAPRLLRSRLSATPCVTSVHRLWQMGGKGRSPPRAV